MEAHSTKRSETLGDSKQTALDFSQQAGTLMHNSRPFIVTAFYI